MVTGLAVVPSVVGNVAETLPLFFSVETETDPNTLKKSFLTPYNVQPFLADRVTSAVYCVPPSNFRVMLSGTGVHETGP